MTTHAWEPEDTLPDLRARTRTTRLPPMEPAPSRKPDRTVFVLWGLALSWTAIFTLIVTGVIHA